MVATRRTGKAAGQDLGRSEIARLLAEAYLRLLRTQAAKRREQAQIRTPDSPELSGYRVPPE